MKRRFLFCLLIGILPFFCPAQDTIPNPSPCQMGIVLNDATCPDDRLFFAPNRIPILVNNAPGSQLGIDVYLKEVHLLIRHDWVSDLDLVLEAPGGRQMELSSDNGGGDAHYGDPDLPGCTGAMIFDAAACQSITQGAALFQEGPYLPEESFLTLNDSLTNPNGVWYLSICDDFEADSGYLEFVELVFAPLSCLPISDVQISSVDTTTVVLHWKETQDCQQTTTIIEYGAPGFSPGQGLAAGQGTVVTTTCPPFNLTGLLPETGYEIYIRKQCGDRFSGNSCGTTVITGCQPPPGRLLTRFDDQETCTGSCGTTDCNLSGIWFNAPDNSVDWQVRSGPTPTQGTGPQSDADGNGKYIYLETSGNDCREGSTAALRSGCFLAEAHPESSCNIAFNYHMFGPDVGSLRLQVSTDGGQSWLTIWQLQNNQGSEWERAYVEFSNYRAGDILQFRFLGTRGRGSQGDIALDNLTIYGLRYEGRPQNQYFADADGDGFGNSNNFIFSCAFVPPPGFVERDGDCNDQREDIHPDQPEIPCDNLDNNCNGDADDLILPPPFTIGDTICEGESALLRAQPVSGKSIFWYTTADDLFEIPEFGTIYSPEIPPNNTAFPQTYTFYAEETDFRCFSEPRAPATVVINPTPEVDFTGQPQLCPGETIDLASLNIQDTRGTGATLAFYSHPDHSESSRISQTIVQPLADTTYFYTMTTDQGCQVTGQIPVSLAPGPELSIEPGADFTLCVESEQEITVRTLTGAPPFSFLWDSGDTSSSLTVTAGRQAGQSADYTLTVTDQFGCAQDTTISVTTISSISSIVRSIQNVSDCAGADGAISITPLGGLLPFTYEWEGTNGISGRAENIPSNSYTIQNLTQGAYRITVTDNSSDACAFRLRTSYVNGPDAEVTEVDIQPVSCAGASDGQICLEVIGAPSFQWNTGDTTACLGNLAGGYYSVTITEANCATILDSLFISEPLPLRVFIDQAPPSCANTPDGSVAIDVFGGSPPYLIAWKDGFQGSQRNNLLPGTYGITITDSNGCMQEEDIVLDSPAAIDISTAQRSDISCTGADDGFLQLAVAGGTPPYQYLWNTGSDRPVLAQLRQAIYTVTVTDFAGCSRTASYPIFEPDPLRLQLQDIQDPICLGDTSGRILVAAQGGRPPYRFNWFDGAEGAERKGLAVGRYRVLVTDDRGCRSDTLEVVLKASSAIEVDAAISPALCLGRSDGQISLTPSGSAPFRYNWSRGDTSSTLTQAAPGTYDVRLTDTNGCILDTSFTIEPLSEPIQPIFNLVQPQCAESMDGRISITISGTPRQPLQYAWNDGPLLKDRERIGEGNYQVTITDALGCQTRSDTLVINSPDPIDILLAGQGNILCQGDNNGFLELDVSGGVPPYSYTWSGLSDTTSSVYGLEAGSYRVFVRDANGCPGQANYQLNNPPALEAEVTVTQGNICIGDSSNSLRLQVSGGIGSYQFSWNTGSMASELRNVAPGAYSVTVSDENGCIRTIPAIKLKDPGQALQLSSFEATNVSCFGARDGALQVNINGGTGPFRYVFSNAALLRSDSNRVRLSGLPPGSSYTVTVIDQNGCVIESAPQVIAEPPPLSIRRDSTLPNVCFGGTEGAIFASVQGGNTPYQYAWYNEENEFISDREDLRRAGAGTYRLVVHDANMCSDTLFNARIEERNSKLRITDTTIFDATCKGLATGSIRLQLIGGAPPYQYEWSNGNTTQHLLNAPAGDYQLQITDSDTCRTQFSGFQIREPETTISITDSLVNPSCPSEMDGLITARIQGGIPPYSLSWDKNGSVIATDTNRIEEVGQGLYRLQITDENQCRREFSFQLFDPDSIRINFQVDPPNNNQADGRLTALVQGGTPAYSFLWNTGDTLNSLTNIPSGNYTVTITDRNGCTASALINLIATSIQNKDRIEKIQVFPNPLGNELNLNLTLAQKDRLRISLFNNKGQLIKQNVQEKALHHELLWPIGNLSSGNYLLRIEADGELIYSGKLIKYE